MRSTAAMQLGRLFRYLHDCVMWGRKNAAQLWYWHGRWLKEGGSLRNDHYRSLMLAVANETTTEFLDGQVVADFGCGPRGSLCWAHSARERIGLDVLAAAYKRFGTARHNMRYVSCSEKEIPLPSACVQVLFTVCTMHYCTDFEAMSRELLRILSPGGIFVASLNLDEPRSALAPHTLTEDMIERNILRRLDVCSYRVAPSGPEGDSYRYMIDPNATGPRGATKYLWVKAVKPVAIGSDRRPQSRSAVYTSE